MSGIYTIESIRHLDGSPHEREARRKGQRVEILNCTVGQALLLAYRDDYNKLLQTSIVGKVHHSDGDETVLVHTQNSEYTFRKVA